MNGYCPNCEKETNITRIRKEEVLKIRGEAIPVVSEVLKCEECNEEFDDPQSEDDPLILAYAEYRRRKGMVQPEQIHAFRKKYGLTQKEMSGLTGIGIATLSRYENGSLQEAIHDKVLQLVMVPRNLLKLVEEDSDGLTIEKKAHLTEILKREVEGENSLLDLFKEISGGWRVDIQSGYKELDPYRLLNMVKFFCQSSVFKTKLNKLLFYADFKHFKEYSVSISGARYAHLPFGPVPDKYKTFYAFISQGSDSPIVEEERWCHDCPGEIFVSRTKPDLSIFVNSELKILTEVEEYFHDYSASMIAEFSHREPGYQATENGELISYCYAEDLQI